MFKQGYMYFELKQSWSLWYNDGAFKRTVLLWWGSFL